MSQRDRTAVNTHPPVGDLGKSIFPAFSVNVPLPANTSAPTPPAPAPSPAPAPRKD